MFLLFLVIAYFLCNLRKFKNGLQAVERVRRDEDEDDCAQGVGTVKPSIYYACRLPVAAGGELVNFQHVAALRKQGWRAFALLDDGSKVAVPSRPYAVPMVQLGESMMFQPDDVLVLPEITPPAAWEKFAALPCRKVMHNQNPYYTFQSFASMQALNAYGLLGGLCCSRFTAQMLARLGTTIDWQVVRPFVLPVFAQMADKPKKRQVAFMPRKRPVDAMLLRQIFSNLYPHMADVPWVEIRNMGRPQVAQVLGESQVFASLSQYEGLGLPPLEAMAAGALVCGFDGQGGQEYAAPDNGFWVAEGDLEGFAHAVAKALDLPAAEAQMRVLMGQAKVSHFTESRFEQELDLAWRALLGPQCDEFLLPQLAGDAHAN